MKCPCESVWRIDLVQRFYIWHFLTFISAVSGIRHGTGANEPKRSFWVGANREAYCALLWLTNGSGMGYVYTYYLVSSRGRACIFLMFLSCGK